MENSAKPKSKENIYCSWNGGTDLENNIENIDITKTEDLINFAVKQKIDLTVVGPEASACHWYR